MEVLVGQLKTCVGKCRSIKLKVLLCCWLCIMSCTLHMCTDYILKFFSHFDDCCSGTAVWCWQWARWSKQWIHLGGWSGQINVGRGFWVMLSVYLKNWNFHLFMQPLLLHIFTIIVVITAPNLCEHFLLSCGITVDGEYVDWGHPWGNRMW